MNALDRLTEIKAELASAGLRRPLRTDSHRVLRNAVWLTVHHITDAGEDGQGVKVHAETPPTEPRWSDAARRTAELFAHAPAHLAWAAEEIDYLRRRNAALVRLTCWQDGLTWALGDPASRNVQRHRERVEEALAALREIPLFREGECEKGCRRTATHELVIEQGDEVERHRRCLECGALSLTCRRAAIAAGMAPPARVRLEPISEGEGA